MDDLPLLEQISEHNTRETKPVNLYSYLRFCGSVMCNTGPSENLWLTKAIGMNTNGCDMPTDSNFAIFLDNWGVVVLSVWGQLNVYACAGNTSK